MSAKNLILTILGFVFLGVGAVGVAIPVMPTTPFVLLAAACFSAGNERFAVWLRQSRFFGPFIENYRTGRGVRTSLKIAGIVFVWTGLVISMLIVQTTWVSVLLAVVGAGVTIHLLLIKTPDDTYSSTTNVKSDEGNIQ